MEGLARVDVVCLDKTGTLTDGADQLRRARDGRRPGPVGGRARARRWPTTPTNATLGALGTAFLPRPVGSGRRPSRSRRPASGAEPPSTATAVAQGPRAGSWAPEILFTGFTPDDSLRARVDDLSSSGQRVLLVARSSAPLEDETLPTPCLRWLSSRSRNRSARTPPTRCATSSPRTWACVSSPATTRGPSGHPRLGWASRRPMNPSTPARCPRTRRSWPTSSTQDRLRSRHAEPEARLRARPAGEGPRRRHDGGRRERRPRPQGRGHRRRHGERRPGDEGRGADRRSSTVASRSSRVVAAGRQVIANIERVASLFLIKNVYSRRWR